jgi:23S rRNA (uracil1939-C5)-methyltransferase
MRRSSPPSAAQFTAAIDALSHEGRGVARVDGKTVFVDNALPGEEVRARYLRHRRRYDEATAVEILRAAPQRVEPRCRHFGICGGCSLQHLAPEAQLQHKQRILFEQLAHIGKVKPTTVLPAMRGPIWGYRRRARLGVRWVPTKGGAVVGFRERNGRHLADIQSCPVLDPAIGEKLTALREVVGSLSCPERIAQIEVVLDANGAVFTLRHLRPLTDDDRRHLKRAADANGWRIYLQPGGVDSVMPLGEGGDLYYEVPHHGVQIHFAPLDFVQINSAINLAAIDRVVDLFEVNPSDTVLDLFCGVGNFTLPLARHVRAVIGVEGERELVARARENARHNHLSNVSFLHADLTTVEIDTQGCNKLLLDPPRSGALEILSRLNLEAVERIVYVSCNPATLARDAGSLVHKQGYRLQGAGVMDMFPHTAHIESIALFRR